MTSHALIARASRTTFTTREPSPFPSESDEHRLPPGQKPSSDGASALRLDWTFIRLRRISCQADGARFDLVLILAESPRDALQSALLYVRSQFRASRPHDACSRASPTSSGPPATPCCPHKWLCCKMRDSFRATVSLEEGLADLRMPFPE